jgi:acetolactate synthase regulatory subunit
MMEQIQYKITDKFTPEVIEEILKVQKQKGLTAESLLDEARKKSSKLHKFFEWDNDKAGDKWRLQQARVLINEVQIIVENKTRYAFENVSISVQNKGCEEEYVREYFPLADIMTDEQKRKQLIARALIEVNYWKERHSELTEFNDVFSSIDKANKRWQKKQ